MLNYAQCYYNNSDIFLAINEEVDMSDKLVIALRLPDKKPSDLKYSEIIELLKQFSALTKGVEDKFGYIQEGSIYLGTAPVTESQYSIIHEQILNSKDGDLDHFLRKHQDWGNAQIGVHREGESPLQMKVLRSIGETLAPQKFKQNDRLRGRVAKISTGKGCYYLGISFLNGYKASSKITESMAIILRNYLVSSTIIEFSGVATYSYGSSFNLYLEDFKVESFEILEDDTVEQWVDDFVNYGKSGWQDLDDPYKVLEDERLS